MRLLVGTSGDAFHELSYNRTDRQLTKVGETKSEAPAWLCAENGLLYAVSEVDGKSGKVSRFREVDGQWRKEWQTDSSSEGTCHCSTARVGSQTFILAANYVGHTVDVLRHDGRLLSSLGFNGSGPFESRQESSHCHQIVQDLQAKYIYVNDLGGDHTHRYTLNQNGQLAAQGQIDHIAGAGPRHTAFHPLFPQLTYTICELTNEIVIHKWSDDKPETLQTVSILPDPTRIKEKNEKYPQPASAGEIQITKDGKFLYASTRYLPDYMGDTILYAAIQDDGRLGPIKHVDTGLIAPWHFSLSVDETLLAVAFKDSGTVCIYDRKPDGSIREIARLENLASVSCALFLD